MTGPPEVEMMDFLRPAAVDIARESWDYRVKKGEGLQDKTWRSR